MWISLSLKGLIKLVVTSFVAGAIAVVVFSSALRGPAEVPATEQGSPTDVQPTPMAPTVPSQLPMPQLPVER